MRISQGDALADSNLFLRFVEQSHPFHPLVITVIREQRGQGNTLWACPQNFTEFWAVATRPKAATGLGFGTVRVESELARLEALFPMLPDDARIYPEWRRLVTQASVSGKPTHDARLMAVAVVHGINNLLTFNGGDFTRFASLVPTVAVVDPRSL